MVMQTVYLYDQIVITKTKQPGVKAETNLFYLPVDENNLACRAAKMLIDEFNITEGAVSYTHLIKEDPLSLLSDVFHEESVHHSFYKSVLLLVCS